MKVDVEPDAWRPPENITRPGAWPEQGFGWLTEASCKPEDEFLDQEGMIGNVFFFLEGWGVGL